MRLFPLLFLFPLFCFGQAFVDDQGDYLTDAEEAL